MSSKRFSMWLPEDLKLQAEHYAKQLHLKTAQVLVMAIEVGLRLISNQMGLKPYKSDENH